jgi:hypothetical protein
MSESLRIVAQYLDRCFSEDQLGCPHLSSHNYRVHPFRSDYFRMIQSADSDSRMAFVDGGNAEIAGAPNFSIQLNRVYFNIFQGQKRIQPSRLSQRVQFISLTFASFRDGEVFFDTRIIPMNDAEKGLLPEDDDLSFSSMDRRLCLGGARADIGRVASIARRYAEWRLATRVAEKELHSGDVVVMDGTLRTAFGSEAKYGAKAYETAKAGDVIFSGLSKSSKLLTTTGLSLLAAVDRLAHESGYLGRWRYYPVADSLSPEHEAAIFIVRLHEQARYVFRYEVQAEQAKRLGDERLDTVMSQLSRNSCDPSFAGYPYGLIDAHINARVPLEEVEPCRALLLSEVSRLGSWQKMGRQIRSGNAHGVIDTLTGVSNR